ncbi:lysophospholipid acyltransferase family protein [Marinitenerispora sediminis]|uniref:lysophospholipid acyltransferase family protein n=1 Tax=Marinitenerispora sediminis TaxID=1931232 RepID=UPI0018F20EAF|nr:lysophospholipid acyltransferase family protein [Marinitenerispora sediminis]
MAPDPAPRAPACPDTDGPALPPAGGADRVADPLDFFRRRLEGERRVDEFGFDPELTDHALLPLMRLFYEHWFRIELRGLDNVPGSGRALLVANHSGVLPFDALMLQVALRDHHPAGRRLRMLVADLVLDLPLLSGLARRAGHTLASPDDAERLLRREELVGVFPEGFKGIGKPFAERYRLQRFGRGGYVATALRTRAPIVPCSIVGAEEIYPKVGELPALARLLGLPYFPVTPAFPLLGPLGLVPLPTRWIIEFGTPVGTAHLAAEAADDPAAIGAISDEVRGEIQRTLDRLVVERGDPFRD